MMKAAAGNGGDGGRDVSVAIAAYNGAAHLPELLDSIVSQTVRPAEIVCADDASSDDTLEVLEKYAAFSPIPIKIIRHEKNVGIIENFLSAFRATSGSFIAYCDQDDVWLDSKLEACLSALGEEGVSFVCHASMITDGDLVDTGEIYYDIDKDVRVRFPGVSLRLDCWGHQIVFDRPTLDVLLEFYECDAFRNSTLGDCFDRGIPFAASLTGDLHAKKQALIKFRRHAGATTGAGISSPEKRARGVAGRVAGRASMLAWREDALRAAVSVLETCEVAGAKSIERSRRAYVDALALVARRLQLARTERFSARIAQMPQLVWHMFAQNLSYGDFKLKDLAADFLTAVYGWRKVEG
jgi:hypothetical protein